jgi:hypothetical protein
MKRIFLLTALLAAALAPARGQGTVNFANSASSAVSNTLTMARLPAGTSFKAALYYLPDTGITPTVGDFDAGGLTLGASVFFQLPGIFSGGTRSTPGPGGETAWFQVRVWETAFGATYWEAVNNSQAQGGRLALVGTSNIIRVTTGNPTITPPTTAGSLIGAGLQGFYFPMIPEPSALGLGLLGAALLLLERRRTS